ncbi:hypothetical protein AC1031_007003 [Aphanomyces cochlioides]|nr:hypothetical protein AC1031_007003 [Aphanomyces cochlioides]
MATPPPCGETDRLVQSDEKFNDADSHTPEGRNVMWSTCSYILWLETMEAVAYYGISQALKNFMEARLGYAKATASAVQSTWRSFCDITPLLGAYIGDERWGRYKSITFFSVWYLAATSLLSFSAHPSALDQHTSVANGAFLVALFVGVGVAHGCLNPNIVTIGADQFLPSEETQKQLFFSYFYLAINLGSTVSYGYLAYLSVDGLGSLIPPSYGYFATFVLSTALMLSAVALFVAHSPRYVDVPVQSDAFTDLFAKFVRGARVSTSLRFIVVGFGFFCLSFVLNLIAVFYDNSTVTSAAVTYTAGFCILVGLGCWISKGMDPSYLDNHEVASILAPVDEIKQVVRVLPFASFLVLWQCVFDQIDANFQSIVQQSDLRLGPGRDAPQIPGAMLGLFDTIGVSLVIPFLEFIVFPKLERARGGVPASPFEKVLTGLLLASFAMLSTGVVESWRRHAGPIDLGDGLGPILDLGTHKPMNAQSWMYMVPNYLLVCFCECLVNVTMYDVFYSNVPMHWKSTAQAINSFMLAMGDNVASIFTLTFAPFIPDDLNQGHLEYMYFCLACVAFVNAVGFGYVMTRMQFATYHGPPPSPSKYGSIP